MSNEMIMINRKAVEKVGTIFTMKVNGEDRVFESCGKKDKVTFFKDEFGRIINLKDIGNKKAYCYTFTIFGKKTKDSFYFEDVTIVSEIEVKEEKVVEAEVAKA